MAVVYRMKDYGNLSNLKTRNNRISTYR